MYVAQTTWGREAGALTPRPLIDSSQHHPAVSLNSHSLGVGFRARHHHCWAPCTWQGCHLAAASASASVAAGETLIAMTPINFCPRILPLQPATLDARFSPT